MRSSRLGPALKSFAGPAGSDARCLRDSSSVAQARACDCSARWIGGDSGSALRSPVTMIVFACLALRHEPAAICAGRLRAALSLRHDRDGCSVRGSGVHRFGGPAAPRSRFGGRRRPSLSTERRASAKARRSRSIGRGRCRDRSRGWRTRPWIARRRARRPGSHSRQRLSRSAFWPGTTSCRPRIAGLHQSNLPDELVAPVGPAVDAVGFEVEPDVVAHHPQRLRRSVRGAAPMVTAARPEDRGSITTHIRLLAGARFDRKPREAASSGDGNRPQPGGTA